MPPPDTLTTVYATDEHVAIRATGDFAILCPVWQTLARGTDGVLDGWTLTTASDLTAVKLGHIVQLSRGTPNAFRGEGELMAVDSVVGGVATLRRIGLASGVGAPLPTASGVQFTFGTMEPQIESVCWDLNQRYDIDANVPGRAPINMYDMRDLREATVLGVLLDRYVAETRTGQGRLPAQDRGVEAGVGDRARPPPRSVGGNLAAKFRRRPSGR